MNVKAKSWKRENLKIRHSGDILHDDWRIWKYASFEGVRISRNPCFYRVLGQKKHSWKVQFLEILEAEKGWF